MLNEKMNAALNEQVNAQNYIQLIYIFQCRITFSLFISFNAGLFLKIKP